MTIEIVWKNQKLQNKARKISRNNFVYGCSDKNKGEEEIEEFMKLMKQGKSQQTLFVSRTLSLNDEDSK